MEVKSSRKSKFKPKNFADLSAQIKDVYNKIKDLRIQGARNIMRMALLTYLQEMRYSNERTYQDRMKRAFDLLVSSRPTEPLMYNSLSICMEIVKKYDYEMAREHMELASARIFDRLNDNKENIARYGAQLIPERAKIMTICHSSTAISVFIEAHELGKEIEIYSCETRPRWQGRETAKELAQAGIKVNMIVDGAMGHYIDDVDIVIVGCDSVDRYGNFANKVGTLTLAELAMNHNKRFYVAGELFKLDYRYPIPIEERAANEIVDPREFKGVEILNPAFDIVPNTLISGGFITEKDLLKPRQFYGIAVKELKRLIP